MFNKSPEENVKYENYAYKWMKEVTYMGTDKEIERIDMNGKTQDVSFAAKS